MPRLSDIALALALLTRWPVRVGDWTRSAEAGWAYPLAGLAVALPAAAAAALALGAGLSPLVAALLAVAVEVFVTGGLHEDGLADTADGIWGGQSRARRLEIMRDSRVGSYGVLAQILGVGLRAALMAELFAAGAIWVPLVGGALLSRAMMVGVMGALPHARSDGLSRSTGRPPAWAIWGALALGAVGAVLAGAIAAVLFAALVALAVALLARAKLGGQTGDILGATQQCTQIAVLMGLAAVA